MVSLPFVRIGQFSQEVCTQVPKGKVKWFNETKGYGFIEQDNGADVFVHHTSIQSDGFRTLKEGEAVEFEIENSPKGPKATAVVKV